MELVKVIDNKVVTDSRTVAEVFGKDHKAVLRDIDKQLTKLIEADEEEWGMHNFGQTYYQSNQNKQYYRMFQLTEDAFALIAMSYVTPQAMKMKVTFLNEFKRMKENITQQNPTNEKDQLIATMKLALTHNQEIEVVKNEVENVKSNVIQMSEKIDSLVTLDYGMQRKLQKEVAKSVYRYITNEVQEVENYKKKLFAEIHREIKDRFAVASYKDVKQKDFQSALNYVKAWIPKQKAGA